MKRKIVSMMLLAALLLTMFQIRLVSAGPQCIGTDLNGDGVVNILDIAIVAKAYGTTPEDPGWNPIADLDGSEIINILDIAMVAKDYGEVFYDWPVVQHDVCHTGYASEEKHFYPPLTLQQEFEVNGQRVDDISYCDGKLFVATGSGPLNNTLYVFCASDGRELWNYGPFGRGAMNCAPAVANGIVYFGGQHDDKLYAFDVETGAKIWEFSGMGSMYSCSPVVYEGLVYAKGNTKLFALDALSGTKIWEFGLSGCGAPAIWNDILYVGSGDGVLYALEAATGREIWRSVGSARWFTTPLIAEGLVFTCPSENAIRALNLTTGSLEWETQLSPQREDQISKLETGAKAYAEGLLYVSIWNGTDEKGGVLALEASSGAQLWHFQMEDIGAYTPIVANGVVYVTGWQSKKLYALDARTGGLLWDSYLGQSGVLILASGTLYLGGRYTVPAFTPA